MITGLDLLSTVDYKLKEDSEPKTVFKLGIIPSYLFALISEDDKLSNIEKAYRILQLTIRGWDNFSGTEHTMAKENIYGREIYVTPISLLEKIPMKVVTELSVKAMELNQLTEPERKN